MREVRPAAEAQTRHTGQAGWPTATAAESDRASNMNITQQAEGNLC